MGFIVSNPCVPRGWQLCTLQRATLPCLLACFILVLYLVLNLVFGLKKSLCTKGLPTLLTDMDLHNYRHGFAQLPTWICTITDMDLHNYRHGFAQLPTLVVFVGKL